MVVHWNYERLSYEKLNNVYLRASKHWLETYRYAASCAHGLLHVNKDQAVSYSRTLTNTTQVKCKKKKNK